MPSTLLGNPLASGAQLLYSGNPWSGHIVPQGEVRLCLHPNASGNAYVGYSGTLTMTSGGFFMSGGGLADGMIIPPGGRYSVPRIACGVSGGLSIYVHADAACSGQARMFYDIS